MNPNTRDLFFQDAFFDIAYYQRAVGVSGNLQLQPLLILCETGHELEIGLIGPRQLANRGRSQGRQTFHRRNPPHNCFSPTGHLWYKDGAYGKSAKKNPPGKGQAGTREPSRMRDVTGWLPPSASGSPRSQAPYPNRNDRFMQNKTALNRPCFA
jgi:hypothetical protein